MRDQGNGRETIWGSGGEGKGLDKGKETGYESDQGKGRKEEDDLA